MNEGTQLIESGAKLASESGGALDMINEQINLLNDMVIQVATAAEEQGTATGDIAENIRQISTLSQSSTENVQQIATLSQEAMQGTQEIAGLIQNSSTGVQQISQASKESNTGIQQIASVSQQSATGAQQSAQSSLQLAELSDQLQQLVGQFKLGENGEIQSATLVGLPRESDLALPKFQHK